MGEDMKITKETKIGDIIPEGYELDQDKSHNKHLDVYEIRFKKKEERNFEWYVEQYLKSHFIYFIREDYVESMKVQLLKGYFKIVDFEIKMGLFKFICKDIAENSNIKLPWLYTLVLVQNYTKHTSRPKIMDICPKEFLDSIFE